MRTPPELTGIIAVILLLFVPPLLFAEIDLGLPTDNGEVISAFYTETTSLLTMMNTAYRMGEYNGEAFFGDSAQSDFYSNSIPVYANARMFSGWGFLEGSYYSASLGSYIRLGDHFSVPLFAFIAGGNMNYSGDIEGQRYGDYSYNALFTGSGLVWSSGLGTLGAFGGYYYYWGDEALRLVKPDNALLENFKFGIIPILNTGKIPLLQYVVSFIRNYLAFDFHEDKLFLSSYEVKGFSPKFLIGDSFNIDSIYYGYSEKQVNPALKKQTHAVGFKMPIGRMFTVEAELGIYKYMETIHGWFGYDSLSDYSLSLNTFVGLKLDPFIIGVTFERDNGWAVGFIAKVPLNFDDPSNIATGYFYFSDDIGGAGSFRQYHRNND